MYIVYIIQSQKTRRYYIGHTNNFSRRLRQHNSGKNISTKSGIPWRLVYQEKVSNKEGAWLREHKIKSYKGGVAFKKLVNG
ncbi:MAG: endonuclease [Candidatus Colwellbacteria bacterium RBG_13_48_8]|uniref:Endonuclease n=1 Tax=Candidatus Colwellbacteria bacterium RBG_13_48_8 TaxID=1797685 RepID=A0A1G1YX81_9BACT|nr:MAG: endonuclease [Candidatus Colwellbacteria bacterium RBG_13_48_8]